MSVVSAALRARSYRLFATLVERGVTPDLRPVLTALPPLAEHLREGEAADEAAALHYHLFHHEVQPVGSVFLDPTGRVGGEVTRSAAVDHGGAVTVGVGLPGDHLVVALRALAGSQDPGRARGVLEGHLLWWLPLWSATVVRHADPFWQAVVRLLVDAVADHAAALPVDVEPIPPFGLSVEPVGPLSDSDGPRRLESVAEWLATPVRSGLHLGPSDLRRLSRKAGAPAGFGDRRRVARTLLRSAARYDALPSVVDEISGLLSGQRREIEARVPDELSGYLAPWRARWRALRRTLDGLAEAGVA